MPRHLHAAPLVHELAGAVARWWWFTGAYLCEFARVDGGDEEGIGCATLADLVRAMRPPVVDVIGIDRADCERLHDLLDGRECLH